MITKCIATPMYKKIKGRLKVDLQHPTTRLVDELGSRGFSVKYISKITGMSPSQVSYRLRLRGVKLWDYRNGSNAVSKEETDKVFKVVRVLPVTILKSVQISNAMRRGKKK